ncbi:MAG: response regulator [Desulfobacterales bacterium]|nr:response regulator [Desulfobacterales bacterium]
MITFASDKTVLVVDDEPDDRNFLSACIEDAGFQVDTAVDGEDALKKINAEIPDLITLDMVMSKMSGIQLFRKMRKDDRFSDIPVIVITAHARDEFGRKDINEFQYYAAIHRPKVILEKPITPEKLAKTIYHILEVVPADEESVIIEKDELKSMINTCDPETLQKIKEMLNK